MTLIFFYTFLTMSLRPGDESIASRGGGEANMSSLPMDLHEDSVARQLFTTNLRDDKKQLGYYILNMYTGNRIHRRYWTDIQIP